MGEKNWVDICREKELSNCTFVKTVLMILVVIYHCMVYWEGEWFDGQPIYRSNTLSILAQWLNSFHIYTFTLVSGYIYAYMRYEKGVYTKFGEFFTNKLRRLFIPYCFVSIIWVIPVVLCFFKYSFQDLLEKFLFGTSPSQLWFLLMLLGVFVFFYPISGFFKDHTLLGIMLLFLLYGIGFIGGIIFPNYFQIFTACMYMLFFGIGFKLRQCGSGICRRIPVFIWIVVDLFLFAIQGWLEIYEGIVFVLMGAMINLLLHIIGALMMFVILQNIAERVNWKGCRLFGFIGNRSMVIYLFHQQIIYISIYLLNGVINPYLHVVVNFVSAMVISLAISTLLMSSKYTRVLVGEK